MKSLILITAGFPFGESEQSFLRTEFDELVKHYRVTLLAPATEEAIMYPIPDTVQVRQYKSRSNRGGRLLLSLPRLISIILRKGYVRKDLKEALKNCSVAQKKVRLRELLSFALQVEQLKETLIPLIEETQAEIVYSYWCEHITLSATELKKKYPSLKVLTRFHGKDLYNERMASGWQPFRYAIAMYCDCLVFACEAGRDYYLSHWGEKWAEKHVVSYLGCQPMELIPCKDMNRLSLVSCSNAIPLKRVNLIIEALALLSDDIKVQWNHIGDGEELESLKQLASERLGARSNITWKFWGYIPNHQLEGIYKQVKPHFFITTSATEGGAPVSIQEAFSAGIPVIATAVGGITELIQGKNTGYLLSENPDPTEIAAAIVAFCEGGLQQHQVMQKAAVMLWNEKLNAKDNAIRFAEILRDFTE